MRNETSYRALAGLILAGNLVSSFATAEPGTETVETRIGTLEYFGGYPTTETAQKLYDELDYQRAVQAYLRALPWWR